jgi:hypothetical protein
VQDPGDVGRTPGTANSLREIELGGDTAALLSLDDRAHNVMELALVPFLGKLAHQSAEPFDPTSDKPPELGSILAAEIIQPIDQRPGRAVEEKQRRPEVMGIGGVNRLVSTASGAVRPGRNQRVEQLTVLADHPPVELDRHHRQGHGEADELEQMRSEHPDALGGGAYGNSNPSLEQAEGCDGDCELPWRVRPVCRPPDQEDYDDEPPARQDKLCPGSTRGAGHG